MLECFAIAPSSKKHVHVQVVDGVVRRFVEAERGARPTFFCDRNEMGQKILYLWRLAILHVRFWHNEQVRFRIVSSGFKNCAYVVLMQQGLDLTIVCCIWTSVREIAEEATRYSARNIILDTLPPAA